MQLMEVGGCPQGYRSTPDTLSGRAGNRVLVALIRGRPSSQSSVGGPTSTERKGDQRGAAWGSGSRDGGCGRSPGAGALASWKGQRAPSLDAQPRRPACRARRGSSRPAEGLPWEANECRGLREPVESRSAPRLSSGGRPGGPSLPLQPLPPSWAGRSRAQVAGRCHGGTYSPALLPQNPNGKDLSVTPLTSDLQTPTSASGACPESSGRQGRPYSTRAGRCPWGTAREHRAGV